MRELREKVKKNNVLTSYDSEASGNRTEARETAQRNDNRYKGQENR